MSFSEPLVVVANTYVTEVKILLEIPQRSMNGAELSVHSVFQELADQAEIVVSASSDLTETAIEELGQPDIATRQQASERLLAKTIVEIEICTALLQYAEAEEVEATDIAFEDERSTSNYRAIEPYLNIILGEATDRESTLPEVERRSSHLPTNLLDARHYLSDTIKDTLDLISEQASETGKSAIDKLLALGLTEIAQVVRAIGMNVAEAIGQAENLSRLYQAAQTLVGHVYQSVMALLGQELAERSAQLMQTWLEEMKEGAWFDELLERLYQTQDTEHRLQSLVETSSIDLPHCLASAQDLDLLGRRYCSQTKLVDKILKLSKYLTVLIPASFPQGRLLLAATYLLLGSYVVLLGGDCLDAQRLGRLNRVVGVSQLVERR
jgi:hypothetical protein